MTIKTSEMKTIVKASILAFLLAFSLPVTVIIPAFGQGVISNYETSWVGNSFGRANNKWVQNYINEIRVDPDGTVYTNSHWDEGGRRNGIYKDGDVIGNRAVAMDGRSAVINGHTWSISDSVIKGPYGKLITDAAKPTSLAVDNDNRLMVTDDGPRQQLLFFDVSNDPELVETFGAEGGIGAHLEIAYSVGDSYPAGVYPRGIYHPYKLWGMTGCGMDERGRIFISTSQNGTVLRAFDKNEAGRWMLDWELFGLFFVDAMDVDPYSDGIDTYGVSEHFRMDYSKDNGAEWRLHGYTVDPVKYPDDPRLFEEIKAGHNHGLTSPFIRYLKGIKFMFVKGMYSQINVFRFEDNGQICYHVKTLPNSFSWWIDYNGDYWTGDGNKVERWSFTGEFDEQGAPVHQKSQVFETDSNIRSINRIIYDEKKDIIYLGCYTATHPQTGDEWGILGRAVYRFENFTASKALTEGYPIILSYDITPASNIASRVFAKDFTVAGDKLFIIWFIRGPYYLEQGYEGDRMRGEISVYRSSTGEYQGAIIPTETIGGPERVGWIDIPNPAVAFERNNGEILLFVEEDGFGKNILYRICKSGDCRNKGYILIDSPLPYSRHLPGQEITLATDYRLNESIEKVEFFAGNTRIGESSSSPYNFSWSTACEGAWEISAAAITVTGDSVRSSNSPLVYVYAPVVDSLAIFPRTGTIRTSDSLQFFWKSYDQFNYSIDASVSWFVPDGGTISPDGVFYPESAGEFDIVAMHGEIADTVSVYVYSPELAGLQIHPRNHLVYTGHELQLHMKANDQFDYEMDADAEWKIFTGEGTIDEYGRYIAGNAPGSVRVTAISGDLSDTLDIRVVVPTSWVNHDIGPVGIKGSADICTENHEFVVNASGTDIWGNTDQFHYIYKPLAGDGQISARVEGFNLTDNWSKVGVMIRETSSPESAHASVFVTGTNGIVCQFRSSTRGISMNVPSGIEGPTAPYWVKIARRGNVINAYKSADGIVWNSFYQFTLTMPDTVLIGLAATSHNNGSLLTANFTDVVSEGLEPVRVAGITAGKNILELTEGETAEISASLIPANSTVNIIFWNTGNPGVATITQAGAVTGVNEGETFLVATSLDGEYRDTCHVTVIKSPISSTDIPRQGLHPELYPNPATDYIVIKNIEGTNYISVFNMMGRKVYQAKTEGPEHLLYTGSLESGIYLIRFSNKNGDMAIARFIRK